MAESVQLLVVITMLSVGLEAGKVGWRTSGLQPRWLGIGIATNIVLFPLGAWLVVSAFGLPEGLAIGSIIVASSPGGPVGPVFARLAQASLSFSTTLMIAVGFIGLVTTPITISVLAGVETGGDLVVTVLLLLLAFQISPLLFGYFVVQLMSPRVAERLVNLVALLANLLLIAVVVFLVIRQGSVLVGVPLAVHAAAIITLAVFLIPMGRHAEKGSLARSCAIITPIRNMSVALLIATNYFDEPEPLAAALVWSFWIVVIPAIASIVAGKFRTVDPGALRNVPSAELQTPLKGSSGRLA